MVGVYTSPGVWWGWNSDFGGMAASSFTIAQRRRSSDGGTSHTSTPLLLLELRRQLHFLRSASAQHARRALQGRQPNLSYTPGTTRKGARYRRAPFRSIAEPGSATLP